MESKRIKRHVHCIAYFLLIASIIFFIFPTVYYIIILTFSNDSSNNFTAISSIKHFILDLCFIYTHLDAIPYASHIIAAICSGWGLFDLIWRTARGHKIHLNYLILFFISIILPTFVFIAKYQLLA